MAIHQLAYHNDRILPVADTRLSPGQAGLLNGWGLFTTMRIYHGQAFAFERHWNRLCRDAERTQLPFPFGSEDVHRALHELIRANCVGEGCARIYFINNQGSSWRSEEPLPPTDLLITTSNLPQFVRPARLSVCAAGRFAAHPLAGTKVTSWLQNAWSLERAQQQGFQEVILLNERGEVAECTSANVFCVLEGALLTPPLASGCLPGVTREILFEIGAENGLPATERTLTLDDLRRATEVFITSTSRELLPVAHIADHRVPQAPGPVAKRLQDAFSGYVTQYFARPAIRP